jgi:N-acetyl-gamma-glutamyl-phosphate reductase
MKKVGIIGAASFASGKLIELLLGHEKVEITYLVSEHFPNEPIEKAHSHLKGVLDLKFEKYDLSEVAKRCEIVFISKHHGVAVKQTPPLLENGIKVIDLSADFRLKNPEVFEKWYGIKHDAIKTLKEAVYGLPELNFKKIKSARIIANPGCYPTSVILGAAPLFKLSLVDTNETIIVDSISGISGAGKGNGSMNGEKLFINLSNNVRPYNVGTHRHTPEMEQELSALAEGEITLLFAPHVGPFNYGITSNIYIPLKDDKITVEEIVKEYKSFYEGKPFIRIYEVDEIPEIKDVVGTNFCDIGIHYDKRTKLCIIFSVLDNIIKGAAGQAIQNMNIMFGFDEKEGLPYKGALNKKERTSLKETTRLLKKLSF